MATISDIRNIAYRMVFEDAGFSAGMKRAAEAARDTAKAGREAAAGVGDVGKEVSRAGPSFADLNKRYDENTRVANATAAANRRFAAEVRQLSIDIAKGARTQEEAAEIERKAGLARDASIDKARAQAEAMRKQFAVAGDAAGVTGRQMQQLVPQLNDVFTTLAGGSPPLQVLIQQGPQISEIFGGVGATLRAVAQSMGPVRLGAIAVGAALAGAFAIAESGDGALRALSNRLRATRDDYASLAVTVDDTAKRVAASSSISTGDARKAGGILAGTPGASSSSADLEGLLRLSQGVAKVFGEDIPAAATRLSTAIQAPGKAAQEMAEGGLRTMNEELARSVERFENQGRKAEAARLVLDAYRRAVGDAANNSSALEKAVSSVFDRMQAGFEQLRGPATFVVEKFAALLKIVQDWDDYANNNPLGRLLGLAQSAATQAGASASTAPGGVRDQTTAERINSADALVRRINPDGRQRQDIADQQQQLNDALALPGVGTDKAKEYRDALASLREQMEGLKGPAAQLIDGLRQQAALANVAEGAAREYATATLNVAKAHGGAAEQEAARAAVESRLSGEMSAALNVTSLAIDGAVRLTAANLQGGEAIRQAEAATRAQVDALKFAKEGTDDYDRAVAGLTGRYVKLAEAQARAKSAATERSQGNTLQTLQRESELVTASAATRDRELAILRETQALEGEQLRTDDERYKRRIANAGAIADATAALSRQRDVWGEIQNTATQAFDRIGSAITEAFTQGKAGAISFGGVAKAIIAEIAQAIIKLALLRPIMNSLLGTNQGTLGDLASSSSSSSSGGGGMLSSLSSLGSIGKLFSSGSGSGATGSAVTGAESGGMFSGLGSSFSGIGSSLAGWGGLFGGGAATGAATTFAASGASGTAAATTGLSYEALAGGAVAPGGGGVGISAGAGTAGGLSALGGIGGGIGLGMLGGSLVGGARGSVNTTQNAMIGSIAGAGIGFLVGGPVGALIGGAIGGTGSGFFGPTKKGMAQRSGGDVAYANVGGQLQVIGAGGKRTDTAANIAQVQQQINEINQSLSSRNLTLGAVSGMVGFGQASRNPTSIAPATIANAISSANPNVQTAINNRGTRSLDQLLGEIDFVQQSYEPAVKAADGASSLSTSLEALWNQFAPLIDRAATLGLATDKLSGAWDKANKAATAAFNEAIRQSDDTLAARAARVGGDSQSADLITYDAQARQEATNYRAQLETWGLAAADVASRMAKLEQVQGAERLQIVQTYADRATQATQEAAQAQAEAIIAAMGQAQQAASATVTSLASYLRGLRTSDASPLSATAQYAGASREFDAVYGAAQAGDARSTASLSSYADTLLKASRGVNGSGAQYADDYRRVVDAVGAIAARDADALTASFFAAQVETQTRTLNASLAGLRDEVASLRREIALNGARAA